MSVAKPKLAYSVAEAAEATGYSPTTIRQAIKSRTLIARYRNSKPVVMAEDLNAWLEDAPTERAS